MKIYFENKLSNYERLKLLKRSSEIYDSDTRKLVEKICRDIKKKGDNALRKYCRKYDKVELNEFRVARLEIEEAKEKVSKELREALNLAASNIMKFHEAQITKANHVTTMEGVECWREPRPIECVGLYVPAGSASLPSTVLMLAIPAKVAGCKRIVLCSPPKKNGKLDPLILVSADIVGISEIYKVGGAQAIAGMAYGTESIPKVDKIFGPGNRYVTSAKQFVSMDPDGAAIDLPAGPSEVLIIADETASSDIVAYDLISQAEHDIDAQAVLVTSCESLAKQVLEKIQSVINTFPRRDIIKSALKNSFILITDSIEQAIKFANEYAPEHLIINVKEADRFAEAINNAGSVFIGSYSPVTAGDYASGTNHTLPTAGSAKWTGGVSVESYTKYITFQRLTKEGLTGLKSVLIDLARAEGLDAHAQAVISRFLYQ